MSSGAAVALTVMLVLVAGATAGFWLNVVMWIPMLLLGRMRDERRAFVLVSLLSMLAAAVAVFLFGRLVMDLPVAAALVAGVLIGITSYASPNVGGYEPDGYAFASDFEIAYDGQADTATVAYERERHVCPECGKGLATANGLAQHLAAKHGSETPLVEG